MAPPQELRREAMWSALAQVLGGAQCWEVKVLAEGRDKARSGYEKPYTEAWEVSPGPLLASAGGLAARLWGVGFEVQIRRNPKCRVQPRARGAVDEIW